MRIDAAASRPRIAWLNGWRRTAQGMQLDAVVQRNRELKVELLPSSVLASKPKVLDTFPSLLPEEDWEPIRIQVEDLSRMLSLVRPPGNFLSKTLPLACHAHHVAFVAEGEEEDAYIPAVLLLTELWVWSHHALHALLTPGSLDLYLRHGDPQEEPAIAASGPLGHGSGSSLRRLSWLAQCADARASWNSVLTFAHSGALNLQLPQASLVAWGMGVRTSKGILVSALASVRIGFSLPIEGALIRIGRHAARCPYPPAWTPHPQPDLWNLVGV